jgi:hypothetical protein
MVIRASVFPEKEFSWLSPTGVGVTVARVCTSREAPPVDGVQQGAGTITQEAATTACHLHKPEYGMCDE